MLIFESYQGKELYNLKDRLDRLGRKNMLDIVFDCITDQDKQVRYHTLGPSIPSCND